MQRPAFSFANDLPATPQQELCVDRHYLLAASRGALRLEVDGMRWSLPPARAALISAGLSILVTVPQPVRTTSVLFSTTFAPTPSETLTVFDLTPLARSLLDECSQWQDEASPLDDYALAMFRALAEVAWSSAVHPSPTFMPTGQSPEVRQALALTADRLANNARLSDIAHEVGLAPRSLARRFEQEIGMTWRGALRRLRVLQAIEQLASTDESVTQIALDVGYSSLSAFQAAFRDLTGKTPSQYRAGFG